MDPKDIRNLVESYQNVYAEQEVSEDMYSTVKSGLEKGSKALENSPAGGVLKMLVGPVGGNKGKRTPSAADQKKKIAANESVELYNIVFNHLIEEGFASSEENAEKIISVMSDEWISSIVNENLSNFAKRAGEVIKNPERALNAAASSITRRLESAATKKQQMKEQDATSSMADRAKRAVANQRSGFHGDDDALTRTQRATQRSIDKLKGSASSMAKEA
jgi:hypothetical protein